MIYLAIVRPIAQHQVFISSQEISGQQPLVPDKSYPARGAKNAAKLGPGRGRVKPVECLAGRDQVHARIGQTSVLRSSVDAGESLILRQDALTRLAHFFVGLDANCRASEIQEEFRQESRAGADVGDSRIRVETALARQQRHDLARVGRPVADVIVHPRRKSFGWFECGHVLILLWCPSYIRWLIRWSYLVVGYSPG